MELFRDISGKMLYFVFSNPEDTFYTESLTGMNLQQYLWYQLKKAGNRGVAFFSGIDRNYCIECMDNESFERLQRTEDGKAFWNKKWFGNNVEIRQKFSVSLSNSADVCNIVKRLLENRNGHQAIVISLDSFVECFGDEKNVGELEKLITLSGVGYQDNHHNTLVITSSMKAESSSVLLMNSLWTKALGRDYLCSELAQILQKEKRCAIYDELSLTMEDRVIMLQSFSKQQISNIVERCALEKTEYYLKSDKEAITLFLFHWMNDKSFRTETESEEIMTDNPLRSYKLFYHDLCKEEIWKEIVSAAGKIKYEYAGALVNSQKRLSKLLGLRYEQGYAHILRTDDLAKTAKRYASHLSDTLKKEFSNTWTKTGGVAAERFYKMCFEELDSSIRKEDYPTRGYVLRAMEGYSKAFGEDGIRGEALDAASKFWEQVISASRQVNLLYKATLEANKDLERMKKGASLISKEKAIQGQEAIIDQYTELAMSQAQMIHYSMFNVNTWLLQGRMEKLQNCSNNMELRSDSVTKMMEQLNFNRVTEGDMVQNFESQISKFRNMTDNKENIRQVSSQDKFKCLQKYMQTGQWEDQTA